jgi:hypothetical protein
MQHRWIIHVMACVCCRATNVGDPDLTIGSRCEFGAYGLRACQKGGGLLRSAT